MKDLSVNIGNHVELGKIIEAWAGDKNAQPTTIREFIQKAQGHVTLGTGYADDDPVNVINLIPGMLNIVVPAAAHMKEPLPTGAWPMPACYTDLAYGVEPVVDESDKEVFRYCRVGDYCMGKCM